MNCKNCGQEIDKEIKFCPNCGSPINDKREVGGKYASKKQKKKKSIYKRWWFWAIIVLVVLIAIGGSGDPAEETAKSAEPSGTVEAIAFKETAISTEESVVDIQETVATDASQDIDMDTVTGLIEVTLKDSFENIIVSYENDIITINIWQDGIAAGALLAQYGNEECLESWNTLVDNQKALCASVLDLVKTLGVSDTSVLINVLNDVDTEKTLLSVVDGVVLYNSVNSK